MPRKGKGGDKAPRPRCKGECKGKGWVIIKVPDPQRPGKMKNFTMDCPDCHGTGQA